MSISPEAIERAMERMRNQTPEEFRAAVFRANPWLPEYIEECRQTALDELGECEFEGLR